MVTTAKKSSSFKTQIISSTDKKLHAAVSVCDPTKVGGFATASMNDNGRPISCCFWILLQAGWWRKISWNSCELVALICSNWHYSSTSNAGDGMEIVCLFIRKGLICQGFCFREAKKVLESWIFIVGGQLSVCNMYEKINMSNILQNCVQNV